MIPVKQGLEVDHEEPRGTWYLGLSRKLVLESKGIFHKEKGKLSPTVKNELKICSFSFDLLLS